MTEEQMKDIMYRNVAVICQQLEIREVAALYMNTVLNGNSGVKNIVGYDKVSYLFTEQDGTKMHEETKEAFLAYCQTRLNQKD